MVPPSLEETELAPLSLEASVHGLERGEAVLEAQLERLQAGARPLDARLEALDAVTDSFSPDLEHRVRTVGPTLAHLGDPRRDAQIATEQRANPVGIAQ